MSKIDRVLGATIVAPVMRYLGVEDAQRSVAFFRDVLDRIGSLSDNLSNECHSERSEESAVRSRSQQISLFGIFREFRERLRIRRAADNTDTALRPLTCSSAVRLDAPRSIWFFVQLPREASKGQG